MNTTQASSPLTNWPRRLVRSLMAGAFAIEVGRAKPRRRKQEIARIAFHGNRPAAHGRRSAPVALTTATIAAARYFSTNYEVVAEYAMRPGPKIKIGSQPKSCRFCGRTEEQVTFKKVAHAVSEALGNKVLLSLEECDDCNAATSEVESDLTNFVRGELTFGQIRGKRGVPSVKARDGRSRIDFGPDGYKIKQFEGGPPLVRFYEDRSGGFADIPLPGFRPQGVYKAIVKMALTVIPRSELHAFAGALGWMMNNKLLLNVGYARAWYTFTSGPCPYPFPLIRVMRRKHDGLRVPYGIVVLGFGNVTLQACLPAPEKDSLFSTSMDAPPPHPTPHVGRPWPYDTQSTQQIPLHSPARVRGLTRAIKLNAERSES
jgi:hypothetical protein